MIERCAWAGNDPLYVHYHDTEWGVPTDDARTLFEFLVLEGAQAGLSWITVLRKRERYRAVFDGFDPERVVRYDDAKKAELLADAGIIRNRAKIEATIANARILAPWLAEEPGALDALIWSHAPTVRRPRPASLADLPASTPESIALARALKARGLRFVGPTTAYALMQSAGLVDDHLDGCWRAA